MKFESTPITLIKYKIYHSMDYKTEILKLLDLHIITVQCVTLLM